MASAIVSYKLSIEESSLILRALESLAENERMLRETMTSPGPDKTRAREREAKARDLYHKLYSATS